MKARKLYGIIGHPVSHSLSPAIHNGWFAATGHEGVYLRLPFPPRDLAVVFPALALLGFRGLNVTYPYKEAAASRCKALRGAARRLGAANCLVRKGRGWLGYNTDGEGFCDFLATLWPGTRREAGGGKAWLLGARVTVLGAGAAARSVVDALLARQPESITVINRGPARLRRPPFTADGVRTLRLGRGERVEEALAEADLVIHATPLGLGGRRGSFPWPLDAIRRDACAIDLNYDPSGITLFLSRIARVERRFDGLGMLIHQAALAYRLWVGGTPDLELAWNGLRERPA